MKIGSYTIPDNRLENLLEPLKILYNKKEGSEVNLIQLAQILGHKTVNSGTFTYKIAGMRAYNLIDGRGNVRVTETGRKIAFPSRDKPNEENEGLIEAITNIPLWRELYQKYTEKGEELPQSSDFWLVLKQICGVTPEVAQNKAEDIKKAYLEEIKLIKAPKQGEKTTLEQTQVGGQGAGGANAKLQEQPNTIEVISLEGGNYKLILPKDNTKEAWIRLKKMVDNFFETIQIE